MQNKRCTKCKINKSIIGFYKKANSYLLRSECKKCSNKTNYDNSKSINGLITKIYNTQKRLSKKRYHNPPNYTKEQLSIWIKSNPCFNKLYYDYKESGFKTYLRPSIDRLNDYNPYTFDNIRLVSWDENRIKNNIDRKEGRNNKNNKPVYKYDTNQNYICKYYSISQASRINNIKHQNISFACKSKTHKSGNYLWHFNKLK